MDTEEVTTKPPSHSTHRKLSRQTPVSKEKYSNSPVFPRRSMTMETRKKHEKGKKY